MDLIMLDIGYFFSYYLLEGSLMSRGRPLSVNDSPTEKDQEIVLLPDFILWETNLFFSFLKQAFE